MTDLKHIERTTSGDINNCALANFDDEKNCQMCQNACPDRERFKCLLARVGRYQCSP